jgi:hypothetical protein
VKLSDRQYDYGEEKGNVFPGLYLNPFYFLAFLYRERYFLDMLGQ